MLPDVSIPQKLAMLLSHALDSVAMVNLLGSELSEVFVEISCLDSKLGQLLSHWSPTHLHSMYT